MKESDFVDDFVSRMFTWAQMPPLKYGRHNVPPTYAGWIAPIRLTAEEMRVKSGLKDIAFTSNELEPNFQLSIVEMLPSLVLHVPDKVELPVKTAVVAEDAQDFEEKSSKSTTGNRKRRIGQGGAISTKDKLIPNDSLTYKPTSTDTVKIVEVDMTTNMQAQRRRKSGAAAQAVVPPSIDFSDIALSSTSSSSSISTFPHAQTRTQIHLNMDKLYSMMNAFFEYFWELELPNTQASAAFFGRIDATNYRDFGLTHRRPDHVNLTVIKARLDGREYMNLLELRRDFDLMFLQAFECFPPDHPAIATAQTLQPEFNTRWHNAFGDIL